MDSIFYKNAKPPYLSQSNQIASDGYAQPNDLGTLTHLYL